MIRNVVVGLLHEGVEPAALQAGLDAIAALDPPGLIREQLFAPICRRIVRVQFEV